MSLRIDSKSKLWAHLLNASRSTWQLLPNSPNNPLSLFSFLTSLPLPNSRSPYRCARVAWLSETCQESIIVGCLICNLWSSPWLCTKGRWTGCIVNVFVAHDLYGTAIILYYCERSIQSFMNSLLGNSPDLIGPHWFIVHILWRGSWCRASPRKLRKSSRILSLDLSNSTKSMSSLV